MIYVNYYTYEFKNKKGVVNSSFICQPEVHFNRKRKQNSRFLCEVCDRLRPVSKIHAQRCVPLPDKTKERKLKVKEGKKGKVTC